MITNYDYLEKNCWHIGSTTLEGVEHLKSLPAFAFKEVYSSEKAEELIENLMESERYYSRDNSVHPSHRVIYSFYAQGPAINI